jgi:hypothetical protein
MGDLEKEEMQRVHDHEPTGRKRYQAIPHDTRKDII